MKAKTKTFSTMRFTRWDLLSKEDKDSIHFQLTLEAGARHLFVGYQQAYWRRFSGNPLNRAWEFIR